MCSIQIKVTIILLMLNGSASNAFADQAISINRYSYLYNQKLESNKAVTVGKGQWLFYSEDKLDSTSEAALEAISGAVKAIELTGTKVIISMVPIKSRIYPEFLPEGEKLTAKGESRYDNFLKYMLLKNINAADINQILISAKKYDQQELLFHPNDTHWTPFGARIAAIPIATAVRLSSTSLNSEVVRYKLTTTVSENYGDLATFFSKDLQDQYLRPVKFLNYTYSTLSDQNAQLLDDTVPQIVLVGSSYSENLRGFRQALSYKLRRDILDASVSGGGIWTPLEDYLKSSTYRNNKPKIIIWEFPEYRLWLDPPDKWLNENILPYLR